MKEITRIHIAKVAYDIEVDAKKNIETYIAALERYASDPEILDDIEIRITELLAEHGVQAGGVITSDDVVAVRAQLGEPSEFAAEGVDHEVSLETSGDEKRRVYRDTDNAVLGGVLAGFAQFFDIDSLWVRLLFIVVLLGSFGTALIVYLILWLIIPPAQTAAQKLQMQGKPVTLESIKSIAADDTKPSEVSRTVRGALRYSGGVLLLLAAIGALIATAVVGAAIFGFNGYLSSDVWRLTETAWFLPMAALFMVSGVLFVVLCSLLASAVFRRAWSKRIGVAVAVVVVAGLITFAGGVSTMIYGQLGEQARIQADRKVSTVSLPTDFAKIKTLTVLADDTVLKNGSIQYIVSDKPRYELEALPGVKSEIVMATDESSATVKVVEADNDSDNRWPFGYFAGPELRIYGPELERIEARADSPSLRYTTERTQEKLAALVRGTSFELMGTFGAVSIDSEGGAVATVSRATIGDLAVTNKGGLVEAGVVRTLAVTLPDACPATSVPDEANALVRVRAVSGGKFTYNTVEQPAKTVGNNCGRVVIGAEDDMEGEW